MGKGEKLPTLGSVEVWAHGTWLTFGEGFGIPFRCV